MEEKEYKFGKLTYKGELDKSILDKFKCVDTETELFYISQPYTLERDGIKVDYRFIVHAIDMREIERGATDAHVEIVLVPCFKEWKTDELEDFMRFVHVHDYYDTADVVEEKEECIGLYSDVLSYGNNITIAYDYYYLTNEEIEKDIWLCNCEGLIEMMSVGAHCLTEINSNIDLYLNKIVNIVYGCGWNKIKSYIKTN